MKQANNSEFFTNTECEYFPCHKGIEAEDFNCLFCFCPLYGIKDCGGKHEFLGENKIKDCSACTFPHHKENYGKVMEKLRNEILF